MVITWKHRIEKGGWFRRARLVARQYKWSVFTDEAFAPTSAYGIVKTDDTPSTDGPTNGHMDS